MTTRRTAVVTGGAGGLGAATAIRLREDGLRVIMIDLSGADVDADVTDEHAMTKVAEEIGASTSS
jgi:3-oxoacyl-[acyl-carrier protein] reductase